MVVAIVFYCFFYPVRVCRFGLVAGAGVNGLWRAWLVDQEGRKSRCGFIPSRYKAEEELVLRRSLLDMAADEAGRRGSARRSFFRRRSKNASTREIAAYSDASINSSSYSAGSAASMLAADELLPPPTYQRVEKLCCKF